MQHSYNIPAKVDFLLNGTHKNIIHSLYLDPCNISVLLSQEVALIATSVWPLQHRSCGRGRVKLNKFQRKAVDVVCSNTFSMIQGPPGII